MGNDKKKKLNPSQIAALKKKRKTFAVVAIFTLLVCCAFSFWAVPNLNGKMKAAGEDFQAGALVENLITGANVIKVSGTAVCVVALVLALLAIAGTMDRMLTPLTLVFGIISLGLVALVVYAMIQ